MAGLVFYLLSSRYTERLYYHYLNEKAQVVAMERFERDELDSVRYQNVVWRRQHAIPTSDELFINMADVERADSLLKEYLTDAQLTRLHHDELVNFSHGDEVGTALVYYDNEGTFAVLLLSRNPYGDAIVRTIGWGLLVLIVLSALVLWLISRLYATRMVNRIDQRYQAERLFVSNASHELNNPLTAIQGECEVTLLRERSPEEYQRSLRNVIRETAHIIGIIQQLLRISHATEPAGEPQTPVALSSCLHAFIDEQTQVEITEDFSVNISEDVLNMALGNIITNARKYSNGKPVLVRVNHRQVEISDHGIGIPTSDLPHIFSPFHRAANTTGIPGHGVGLSLAKSLLERHGATLAVKSTGKDGTSFVVKFK